MPKVPTYDNFQATTTASPDVQVRAPLLPDTAGKVAQQLGQGLQSVGSTLAKEAADMQATINEAQVSTMDARYADAIRAGLYDPEKGFLAAKGADAISRRDAAVSGVQDIQKAIEKDAQNDAQRELWSKVSATRRQAALNKIDEHTGAQVVAFRETASLARASSLAQDMVVNAAGASITGSQFGVAHATFLHELQQQAQLKGLGGAETDSSKQYVLTGTTAAHANVISDLLSRNNPEGAAAYFTAHIKEIDPTKQDALRKAVQESSLDTRAFDLVNTALAGANGDYGAAMKTILAVKDGKLARGAEEELHRRQTYDRLANAERDEKLYGSGRLLVEQGKAWKTVGASEQYRGLSDGKKAELKNYYDTHQRELRAIAGAGTSKTNPEVYQDLYNKYSDDPKAFAEMDLAPYFAKLDQADRETFIKLRGDLRSGKKKSAEAANESQQISSYSKTIKGAAEQAAFTQAAHTAIQAKIDAGERVDYTIRKNILDDLILLRNPGMLRSNTPGYKLTPEERKALPIKIPEIELREIMSAFEKRGKKPTDEEIQAKYRQWKGLK